MDGPADIHTVLGVSNWPGSGFLVVNDLLRYFSPVEACSPSSNALISSILGVLANEKTTSLQSICSSFQTRSANTQGGQSVVG